MEFVDFLPDFDGMAGVITTLESNDVICVFRIIVNNFAFPFIAPLRPYD
jgi:hypothetical protein